MARVVKGLPQQANCQRYRHQRNHSEGFTATTDAQMRASSLPDLARMADRLNDAGTAKVLKKDN